MNIFRLLEFCVSFIADFRHQSWRIYQCLSIVNSEIIFFALSFYLEQTNFGGCVRIDGNNTIKTQNALFSIVHKPWKYCCYRNRKNNKICICDFVVDIKEDASLRTGTKLPKYAQTVFYKFSSLVSPFIASFWQLNFSKKVRRCCVGRFIFVYVMTIRVAQ